MTSATIPFSWRVKPSIPKNSQFIRVTQTIPSEERIVNCIQYGYRNRKSTNKSLIDLWIYPNELSSNIAVKEDEVNLGDVFILGTPDRICRILLGL